MTWSATGRIDTLGNVILSRDLGQSIVAESSTATLLEKWPATDLILVYRCGIHIENYPRHVLDSSLIQHPWCSSYQQALQGADNDANNLNLVFWVEGTHIKHAGSMFDTCVLAAPYFRTVYTELFFSPFILEREMTHKSSRHFQPAMDIISHVHLQIVLICFFFFSGTWLKQVAGFRSSRPLIGSFFTLTRLFRFPNGSFLLWFLILIEFCHYSFSFLFYLLTELSFKFTYRINELLLFLFSFHFRLKKNGDEMNDTHF